jgi:NAD(P)-dependent dehydrogenase (short-subunit alcohol dehydrogenase family)
MSRADAPPLLRENLLAGVAVLVAHAGCSPDTNTDTDTGTGADKGAGAASGAGTAHADRVNPAGAPADSYAAAVAELAGGLGARLASCEPARAGSDADEEAALEQAVAHELARLGSIDMLVVDAAGLFAATRAAGSAAAPGGERAMLIDCLQASWNVTRAVVNGAFLARAPQGTDGRGGRIVYIAPPPGAGDHAEAARAGLENLARTLSIEWARYGITPVTIAPGESTTASEVAALSAYLAAPAGAYFSGCLLDLRGPRGR